MKRVILLAVLSASFGLSVFAHEAFRLVSSEKLTLTRAQVEDLQKQASVGTKSGTNLTFNDSDVKLVIVTGPEDDMLSYRIQGMRNPTIVTPGDVKLTIWFVNVDVDMRHDIRLGHKMGDFTIDPGVASTVGTEKLTATEDQKQPVQAQKIVVTSNADGAYKYYCSVRGHAKGGMWGNILVGVKPTESVKAPEKTQHVHKPDEEATPSTAPPHAGHGTTPTSTDHGGGMAAVSNIGDPMSRESSGTAWGPDSSPVYARMKMTGGGGMWMVMGTAFLRYTSVGSTRDLSAAGEGDRARVDAPTMFMAMYSHPIGEKAQIGFRGMFSLDPVIQRGYGYPLLYQSGELYRGQPIHDRQHPHDLVSELAATYSYKFDNKRSFYLYAGLPGEPALGPPMFLHRTSGMNNPDAPISHHWQDATHITYGVVTAGFSFGKAKIEASAFNGTEPDENRWNFDRPRLNSFSGRFSFNPTKNWALQISHGYLKNPEPHEPDIRVLRKTTVSAIYNKRIDDDRNFAGSFVWGQNHANGERTNAILFEGNYDLYRNAVFGRFETVQKSGHDLVLPHPLDHEVFRVNAGSLGYVRDVFTGNGISLGLGGMVTINKNPAALIPVYGGTTHGGWQLFMRLRPSKL